MIGYMVCLALIITAIIISGIAQTRVMTTYNKFKNVASSLDLTGAELAQKLAEVEGVNINIDMCNGTLSDHYDSSTKTLSISQENYYSKSLASQAIVAHEFGHALQDATGYAPLKIRQVVIKTSNLISKLLLPMIIIGLLCEFFLFTGGIIIIYAYIGIYTVAVIASLVTLPVEYNASSRAKKLLYSYGCTSNEEVIGANELLNAAALTYVASLLVSITFLLRLVYLLFASKR